jgi:riboflavin biosynthesis pyrimidine reductase
MNLVFVQSREGNTGADDPSALGGGETDKHVLYEGLSRVAADGVMVGAKTAGEGDIILSLWHPDLVALRARLAKPRHPTQIVATLTGALPLENGLLYNAPHVPVIIVSAGKVAEDLRARVRARPWISVVTSGPKPDLARAAERLRADFGLDRISAVGGRTLATGLIDARLVVDLYLTTSPISGGTSATPMYSGKRPHGRDLVIQKRSAAGVVFEHFILR